jgi:undecaprenyl pyrophosphate phosphatase UppP
VCLTEQAFGGALQHLQRNIAANMHLPNMGSVTCCACDWTHFNDAAVLQAAAAAAAVVQFEDTVTTTCSGSIQQHKQEEQQQQQQQQQPPADVSEGQPGSSVSRQELLDLNKLVTTSWDIIIGGVLLLLCHCMFVCCCPATCCPA